MPRYPGILLLALVIDIMTMPAHGDAQCDKPVNTKTTETVTCYEPTTDTYYVMTCAKNGNGGFCVTPMIAPNGTYHMLKQYCMMVNNVWTCNKPVGVAM